MKTITYALWLILGVSAFTSAEVVFNLNASSLSSYLQKGAEKRGNVTVSESTHPYIDFNKDGVIKIPGVCFPKKAFTIESRFILDKYASTDPIISDLLGTFDCDYNHNGSTEGTELRVGGGYNYPIRFEDAWDNLQEYVHPNNVLERAELSKCIGEMALGTGVHIWKEVYTDRGIETGTWTHMTSTWDGQEMRIFLNGHEATDGWRTIGLDEPGLIRDTSTLFIGDQDFNLRRHFNGKIDFLKIHDKALTLQEIRTNYNQSADNNNSCIFQIIITSPKAGEAITLSTKIAYSVVFTDACTTTPIPKNFVIQISSDPTFSSDIISLPSNSLETVLSDLLTSGITLETGVLFIRIATGQSGLAKSSAAAPSTVQSAPQPVYFVVKPTTDAQLVPGAGKISLTTSAKARTLYDCNGRRLQTSKGLFSLCSVRNGVYLIESNNSGLRKIAHVK